MQALSRNVDEEQRQKDSDVTVLVLRMDLRQALRPARCARVRQPTGAARVKPPGAGKKREFLERIFKIFELETIAISS